jgi:hypothetical protein
MSGLNLSVAFSSATGLAQDSKIPAEIRSEDEARDCLRKVRLLVLIVAGLFGGLKFQYWKKIAEKWN